MNEFRISKYNPVYRINGIYTQNEWSSCADVGRRFEDGVLTEQECRETIDRYVQCALGMLKTAGVRTLTVSGLEADEEKIRWQNGQMLALNESADAIGDCLCEACWCRLSAENAFVHFGYELYMYIGCNLEADEADEITSAYSLFLEKRESPYKEEL